MQSPEKLTGDAAAAERAHWSRSVERLKRINSTRDAVAGDSSPGMQQLTGDAVSHRSHARDRGDKSNGSLEQNSRSTCTQVADDEGERLKTTEDGSGDEADESGVT